MKLWIISSGRCGYDTYDAAVVAASTKKKARETHPDGKGGYRHGWVAPANVIVEYLGEAKKGTRSGVICASFQAG